MSEIKGLSDSLRDWLDSEVPYEVAEKLAWKIIKNRGYYSSPIVYTSGMNWNYYPKSNKSHVMEAYDELTLKIIETKGRGEKFFKFVKEKLPR